MKQKQISMLTKYLIVFRATCIGRYLKDILLINCNFNHAVHSCKRMKIRTPDTYLSYKGSHKYFIVPRFPIEIFTLPFEKHSLIEF